MTEQNWKNYYFKWSLGDTVFYRTTSCNFEGKEYTETLEGVIDKISNDDPRDVWIHVKFPDGLTMWFKASDDKISKTKDISATRLSSK